MSPHSAATRRRPGRRGLLLSLLALPVFLVIGRTALRPPIRAVAWEPPPARPMPAEAERPGAFAALERLPLPGGHGPESVVAGPDGRLYTGMKDGRIVRFRPDGSAPEAYAETGGRPNGMAFDDRGRLYVADSHRGLLAVEPDGEVAVLAEGADGQPFVFPDGLDIAPDGTVWLTDATARFPDGEFHYDVLEGRATGRLLAYEPRAGRIRTRASGLRFPNGVAVGPEGRFVLVNETLGYRTLRHWVAGPKAGRTEPFVEGYPGMPDDLRRGDDGLFWVAFAARRRGWVDWLQPRPRLKTLVAAAIGPLFPDTDTRWLGDAALLLAFDGAGRIVHVLRDRSRRYVTSTGVLEHGGHLYVGSVVEPAVGRIPVPRAGTPTEGEPEARRPAPSRRAGRPRPRAGG